MEGKGMDLDPVAVDAEIDVEEGVVEGDSLGRNEDGDMRSDWSMYSDLGSLLGYGGIRSDLVWGSESSNRIIVAVADIGEGRVEERVVIVEAADTVVGVGSVAFVGILLAQYQSHSRDRYHYRNTLLLL